MGGAFLYELTCSENTMNGTRTITRYSSTPFNTTTLPYFKKPNGLRYPSGLRYPNGLKFLILECAKGRFAVPPNMPESRSSQTIDKFETEDNDKRFWVGKDFIVDFWEPCKLRIKSLEVIGFLQEQLPYRSDETSAGEYTISEPFEALAFSHAVMGRLMANDLRVMMESYEPYWRREIEPELRNHERQEASYKKLWLLYQPGTMVVAGHDGNAVSYIVRSIRQSIGDPSETALVSGSYWLLSLWNLDLDDGQIFRRSKATDVRIRQYQGAISINELPVRPASQKACFVSRGKLYLHLMRQAPVLQQYDGPLNGNNALRYSGAVIVDPVISHERLKDYSTIGTIAKPFNIEDLTNLTEPDDDGGGPQFCHLNHASITDLDLDEEELCLLPARVWGFALGKKQWALFDVTGMRETITSSATEDVFSNLEIDKDDLELLTALGEATSFKQSDFVSGKGLGNVVLLHGPPGVGKSFTVECLAQHLRRPLLPLTVADIGTDQASVEQKLSEWLDLGQRWNAIILLDEADTYLERRWHNDVTRNALVTSFLRVLEYYPGLLFFTTNQPVWIDDAFISRFHVCVEYKELDQARRKRIWQNFIDKTYRETEHSELKITVAENVITHVSKNAAIIALSFNGRDIRNAFQTAVKLAEYRFHKSRTVDAGRTKESETDDTSNKAGNAPDYVVVTTDDIDRVIQNKKHFRAYLENSHGQSEAKRAFDAGARGPTRPLRRSGAP